MTVPQLVSVVIPIFNADQFVREAIESVLAQTYSDWELVLVDDGSSDRSTAIAMEYAARDPGRVFYVTHSGGATRGLSASRNLGIAHARGEYVTFLDADDTWFPHKLERQTAMLNRHQDAGMVYGVSQWWYSWTDEPQDATRDFVYPLGVPAGVAIEPPALIEPFFVRQEAAIPHPGSILVRRSLLERIGGFEEAWASGGRPDTSFRDLYEDQALYGKICVHASVVASAECWYRYRQHPASMTAQATRLGQDVEARVFFLEWLIRYLTAHGLGQSELCAELARQRFRYRHPRLAGLARWIGGPYAKAR